MKIKNPCFFMLAFISTMVDGARVTMQLPAEYVLELQALSDDQKNQIRNCMRNFLQGRQNDLDEIDSKVRLLWLKIEFYLKFERQKEIENLSRSMLEQDALELLEDLRCIHSAINPENSPYQEIAESYDCEL